MRDRHLDTLLEVYTESVKETSQRFNYEGPIPTSRDVKNCLNKLSYLSTTISLCTLPFFIMSGKHNDQEKANDMMEELIAEELPSEVLTKGIDATFEDRD